MEQSRVKTLQHNKQTSEQKRILTIITTGPCNTPAKIAHQFISPLAKGTLCLGCHWIKCLLADKSN